MLMALRSNEPCLVCKHMEGGNFSSWCCKLAPKFVSPYGKGGPTLRWNSPADTSRPPSPGSQAHTSLGRGRMWHTGPTLVCSRRVESSSLGFSEVPCGGSHSFHLNRSGSSQGPQPSAANR